MVVLKWTGTKHTWKSHGITIEMEKFFSKGLKHTKHFEDTGQAYEIQFEEEGVFTYDKRDFIPVTYKEVLEDKQK